MADRAIVQTSVRLSVVEVGLGSVLHGIHIPFRGHFLSLNQGAFLCHFVQNASCIRSRLQLYKALVEIAAVTASLKTLSPAGNKLGPMISIFFQGALFGLGPGVFGQGRFSRLGQRVGMVLLSLWAFVQPVLTYGIIFGPDLVQAAQRYQSMLTDQGLSNSTLLGILGAVIGLKLILAAAIPSWVQRLFELNFFSTRGQRLPSLPSHRSPLVATLVQLTRPFFLTTILLMFGYFILIGQNYSQAALSLARPLGIAFALFYFIHSPLVLKILGWFCNRFAFSRRLRRLVENAFEQLQYGGKSGLSKESPDYPSIRVGAGEL